MAHHRQTHLKDFKQRVLGLRKEQKISVLGVSRKEGELCGGTPVGFGESLTSSII
jgi:hypothetical protein